MNYQELIASCLRHYCMDEGQVSKIELHAETPAVQKIISGSQPNEKGYSPLLSEATFDVMNCCEEELKEFQVLSIGIKDEQTLIVCL